MARSKTSEAQPDLLPPMKDVTPKPTKKGLQSAAEAVEADQKAAMRERDRGVVHRPAHPKEKESFRPEQKVAAKNAVTVRESRAPKAPANDNPNMLAVIARAAADPSVNVEKMQALLSMQKEIVAEEARMASIRAFIALQDDLPSIGRDGKIEIIKKGADGQRVAGRDRVEQSTPYATFNNIMRILKPLLKKHGFGLHFETQPIGERLLVRGVLAHNLGHVRMTEFPLPAETSGSKNNVQGWGSSMSYGKRYAVIALVNIISEAQEDRDTDGNPNKATLQDAKGGGFVDVEPRAKIGKAQQEELLRIIDDCGVPLGAFHTHYEIEKIGDLPADLFDAAKKRCEDHKKKKAVKNG